jgi:hypothetical protein
MLSSDFGVDPLDFNSAMKEEKELTDYIAGLDTPRTQKESVEQFKGLYEKVSLDDWCDTELVFDLGNYIMRHRPDLICMGIRLNVQVNLFLRSIKKYASNPEAIFNKVGHKIGCFALTEEEAGVLSGLIVETTFEEVEDGYILNTEESMKNWISQGIFAEYAIVYAKNVEDKTDIRIFLVELENESLEQIPIDVLPVNQTLDMAKLRFNAMKVDKSPSLLENSKKSTKMDLLNGIFFGRYMIAEATISAMLGLIDHLQSNVGQKEKFAKLGFLDYLNECDEAFYKYKRLLYQNRSKILFDSENKDSLFETNCFKIYTVEKSVEVFHRLQMIFGMHASTYPLRFENLLLHKVAEGDTYVLRVSLIHSHFKTGMMNMLTKPGFSFIDIYNLYQMNDKREKFRYIMKNFKEISNNIIYANIPLLEC